MREGKERKWMWIRAEVLYNLESQHSGQHPTVYQKCCSPNKWPKVLVIIDILIGKHIDKRWTGKRENEWKELRSNWNPLHKPNISLGQCIIVYQTNEIWSDVSNGVLVRPRIIISLDFAVGIFSECLVVYSLLKGQGGVAHGTAIEASNNKVKNKLLGATTNPHAYDYFSDSWKETEAMCIAYSAIPSKVQLRTRANRTRNLLVPAHYYYLLMVLLLHVYILTASHTCTHVPRTMALLARNNCS